MYNIVTVLRTGGEFTIKDFYKLKDNINKFVNLDNFNLYCFSDSDEEFEEKIELENDYPKWWSKLEMFNFEHWNQNDKNFYMDLNTVITGDFSQYVFDHNYDFISLQDVYRRKKDHYSVQSSLMFFKPYQMKFIYDEFYENPEFYMRKYSALGDQKYIEEKLKENNKTMKFFNEIFPNKFVSYKVDCCYDLRGQNFKGIPEETDIVYFHGRPRPSDPKVNYCGY